MAKDVHPPRGMRDFLPREKAHRERVLATIRDTYVARGFQEVETPALEDINRLTSGQGGDNEKLAFRVQKRGAEFEAALAGGATPDTLTTPDTLADLGLRFDLTVPLTRYYATNRAALPNVFKAFQAGPVWRAERPQKGRYRQFVQCDIDIIGDSSELAEVELLAASLNALAAIGLSQAVIRVNHRALLLRALQHLGVPAAGHTAAMIIIDKLDKLGAAGVTAELAERFGAHVASAASDWLAALPQPGQPDSAAGELPAELASIFAIISGSHGAGRLRYDPTLVRGMGYYTGAIFEIELPGASSSIGGGGRYDEMVGRWSGQPVPAVGISIGFERVVELATPPGDAHDKSVVFIVDAASPPALTAALALQAQALAAGYRTRIERQPNKLGAALNQLAAEGYSHWIRVEPAQVDAEFAALSLKPIAAQ